jgi:hypothetical protein
MNRMQDDTSMNPVSSTKCVLTLLLILAPSLAADSVNAEELTYEMRVERGQVSANMRLIRVKQNDIVTLRWSSDRPIALHFHGYDIEQKIEPGSVSEMKFTARATGRFPVREHKPQAGGGHSHGAAIVQIEVLPR